MDDTTKQIVFGLVAPLAIATGVIAPGCRRAGELRDRLAWRIPLGLGVPVVLAFVALYGRVTEKWQSMVYAAAAAVIIGVVMSVTPRRAWLRAVLLAALAAASSLAIWPVLSMESSWWWRLAPAVGVFVLAAALEPLAVRRPGVSLPGALTIACATAAGVVLHAGFSKATVPFGALAVSLGACAAISLFWRRLSLADGAVAIVASTLVVLPLVTWIYQSPFDDSLNGLGFVLPVAAPLLLWLGELRIVRDRPPWLAVTTRWLLVGAVCAAAAVLALGVFADAATSDDLDDTYREMIGG